MASIPFAFSIHHFVNSVGSYAGFAAIIGLAVLVLLFFAQARETHNLRQQASEADERVAQLESRLAWQSRQQAGATEATAQFPGAVRAAPAAAAVGAARSPTPKPAFAGAPAPAPGPPAGVAAVAPGPPAGVAAPALAAATRLIPAVSAPSQLASPATSAVAAPPPTGAGAAPLASPQPRSASGPASAYTAAPGDGATLAAPPPPTTAAGGAGGANGDVRDRVYGGAAGRPMLPPPAQREARRPWSGRVFAALLAALVIAGIVVALLIVTSNSGTNSATSSAKATNASAAHKAKRSTTFRPSSVTVAVLNGTGVAGLARRVATRLGTAGYKQGTVTNASDQTHTATVIAYLPNHRNDALKVASSLKLGPGAVQPVDAGTQQVACPPGMTCAADVVVTVGTDLASQP